MIAILVMILPYPDDSTKKIENGLVENVGKKTEIFVFYRPDCIDCIRTKSKIRMARLDAIIQNKNLKLYYINTNKKSNQNLVYRFQVTSVPTIVRIERNKSVVRYSGTNWAYIKKIFVKGQYK